MSEELHNLFHRLWTKAVGQEGYIKNEWLELERLMSKAIFVSGSLCDQPNVNWTDLTTRTRNGTTYS